MRIGAAPGPSPYLMVYVAQSVVRAASNKSSSTDRPIEPITAPQRPISSPQVGPHALDIRV